MDTEKDWNPHSPEHSTTYHPQSSVPNGHSNYILQTSISSPISSPSTPTTEIITPRKRKPTIITHHEDLRQNRPRKDLNERSVTRPTMYHKKKPLMVKQKKRFAELRKSESMKDIRALPSIPRISIKIRDGEEGPETIFMKYFHEDFGYYQRTVVEAVANDHQSRVLAQRQRMQSTSNRKPFEDILKNSRTSFASPKPPQPHLPHYELLNRRKEELNQQFQKKNVVKRRRWRTQLEQDKLNHVQKTLNKSGPISQLPGASCESQDIRRLRPQQWLNDEIANFYGVMINLRSQAYENSRSDPNLKTDLPESEKFLRVHCFSSFFISKYDKDGFEGVKRWSKKFDLFEKDMIIIPVNVGNAHWTCAAINVKKKRFEYYDSLGHQNPSVLDNLRDYVENEHLAKRKSPLDTSEWTCYHRKDTPQQSNGYDCGIFVCQFMDCLSRDWGNGDTIFDFSQDNIPYIRTKMIYEVSTCQLLPEEWT